MTLVHMLQTNATRIRWQKKERNESSSPKCSNPLEKLKNEGEKMKRGITTYAWLRLRVSTWLVAVHSDQYCREL